SLLLFLISFSPSLAQLKGVCVCGPNRLPCECLPDQKETLNNLRDRVFRAFSVPSVPAPKPVQPQYFVLSRNIQSANFVQSIDEPIGYVLTTSPAEAFYLDATTGQLIPTTRPRTNPTKNSFFTPPYQPLPQSPSLSPLPQSLSTSSRPSLLLNGGSPQASFRASRMIRHPSNPVYFNPGVSPPSIPPQGIPFPVSGPFYPPQQPQPHRIIQYKQSPDPVLDFSEPNLVPVSQLTRIVKQRHAKKFILEKPRPGDVEDLSFVDGIDVVDGDIERKYKSFIAGSPPSASLDEPRETIRTRPRSILETLPSALIAKVANRLASKLPPPKFSFSITPSKSIPSF
ncbi:hypothetical protein PMAYCL1PPCAC_29680, partial [Pristionchus mayeri]